MPNQTVATKTFFPSENFATWSSIIFYKCSLEDGFPIVNISHNVEEILGYIPDDFYGNPTFWAGKIHPEDQSSVNTIFKDIIAQKNRTFVYRFKQYDGNYIWLRDENTVLFDADGEPRGIAGTVIEITRQKQAENKFKTLNATLEQRINERTQSLTTANRKLKKQIQYRNKAESKFSKQQKKLKLLQAGINYINDMVVISKAPVDDPINSSIVFVNKAFERFTGYAFKEVKGQRPNFLHGPKTQQDKIDMLNEKITQSEAVRLEFLNYKKDGTTYWVELEMSPFPAEEDDMQYWVGINRDISKRKEAEAALEENEKKYRAYTELSFDAIFEIALDGSILDCNARACSLFGYSREELLGMQTKNFTPDEYIDDLPQQITPNITTGSEVLQREYKKKDGTVFPCEINTKIYHRNDKDHLIAYVRNISEQIKFQETIEQSLREKETLLAEVHHRVKNNLAVISGLLEMQTFNAKDERIAKELKESQSRIQSIATVHEILYQSESFSDIALHSYIDELASFIAGTFGPHDKNIHFEKEIEPISLTVKQAVPCGLLLNELITNAYKHAFEGRSEGIITIKLFKKADTIHLQVSDNGVGLPEDFEASSSSLGMTLINTLVRQLGGSLTIVGSPSACFHITFDIED